MLFTIVDLNGLLGGVFALVSTCVSRDDIEGALQVAGSGGEVDLDGGFGEASPSHTAQAVAAFPRAEDLLGPSTHAMDWLVPRIETGERLALVAASHGGQNDTRRAVLLANSVAETGAAVGAVSEDIAGIVGQRVRAARPSVALAV